MSFEERLLEFFMPWKSSKWVMWKSQKSITTCLRCRELHGKIFPLPENYLTKKEARKIGGFYEKQKEKHI